MIISCVFLVTNRHLKKNGVLIFWCLDLLTSTVAFKNRVFVCFCSVYVRLFVQASSSVKMPLLIIVKQCCRTHFLPSRRTYSRAAVGRLKLSLFSSTTAAGIIVGFSSMANIVPKAEVNTAVPASGLGMDKGKGYIGGVGEGGSSGVSKMTEWERVNSEIENKLARMEMKNWAWLAEKSPGFAVKGSNVRVITCPNVFYETLLEKIENARQRISLASLYLGNGSMEHDMVRGVKMRG